MHARIGARRARVARLGRLAVAARAVAARLAFAFVGLVGGVIGIVFGHNFLSRQAAISVRQSALEIEPMGILPTTG